MSSFFNALVWVFAVGTCVSVAMAFVAIPLALRHRHQLTKGKLGIILKHPIAVPRSLTVADLLVEPLGREGREGLRQWVRVQRAGSVEQPPNDDIRPG